MAFTITGPTIADMRLEFAQEIKDVESKILLSTQLKIEEKDILLKALDLYKDFMLGRLR